eukprot:2331144-Prorocentrum_lima.AAC.1
MTHSHKDGHHSENAIATACILQTIIVMPLWKKTWKPMLPPTNLLNVDDGKLHMLARKAGIYLLLSLIHI